MIRPPAVIGSSSQTTRVMFVQITTAYLIKSTTRLHVDSLLFLQAYVQQMLVIILHTCILLRHNNVTKIIQFSMVSIINNENFTNT